MSEVKAPSNLELSAPFSATSYVSKAKINRLERLITVADRHKPRHRGGKAVPFRKIVSGESPNMSSLSRPNRTNTGQLLIDTYTNDRDTFINKTVSNINSTKTGVALLALCAFVGKESSGLRPPSLVIPQIEVCTDNVKSRTSGDVREPHVNVLMEPYDVGRTYMNLGNKDLYNLRLESFNNPLFTGKVAVGSLMTLGQLPQAVRRQSEVLTILTEGKLWETEVAGVFGVDTFDYLSDVWSTAMDQASPLRAAQSVLETLRS